MQDGPKLISPSLAAEWLAKRRITEAPYGKSEGRRRRVGQFPISNADNFAGAVIQAIRIQRECLLVLQDWLFYQDDDWQYYEPWQLPLLEMVREAALARDSDFDGGLAFLYGPDLVQDLSLHIRMSIYLGWTAYLYTDVANTSVLFWEGELMDVWSDSILTFGRITRAARRLASPKAPA
jgi:hypothetical protein